MQVLLENSQILNYLIIPILIFLIRVIDVSMGTIRIIFISRGIQVLAAIIGFFEILIWLIAITQIMKNLNSPSYYLAYATGFAVGNFVGISIEKRFSLGHRAVRVITSADAEGLIKALRAKGYGVTSVQCDGAIGPTKLIFSIVRQNLVNDVLKIVQKFNPHAFYTVEDVRFASDRMRSVSDPPSKTIRQWISFIHKKK